MSVTITYSALPGTRAGIARTGGTTVIADRAPGNAGGEGLGANGAQLLASAIGGCFWNDIQAIADRLSIAVDGATVSVSLELGGDPRRVTAARLTARMPEPARPVFDAAVTETIIGHSVMPAFPVSFTFEELPA